MLKLVGCIIGTSQERLDKSSEQMRSHRVLAKARVAKVYMSLLKKIYLLMRALMMSRQRLEAEVEALRQQLAELRRTSSSRDSEGKGRSRATSPLWGRHPNVLMRERGSA